MNTYNQFFEGTLAKDVRYYTGNYIGRGPQSLAVLEEVMKVMYTSILLGISLTTDFLPVFQIVFPPDLSS